MERWVRFALIVCAVALTCAAPTPSAADAETNSSEDPALTAFSRHDFFTAAELLLGPSRGHNMAPALLGQLYRCGLGVVKDEVEAIYWYRRAKEGPVDVSAYLSPLETRHPNVAHSGPVLVAALEKEATSFFSNARIRLARIYLDGRGVDRDLAKAYQYFSEAGTLGHADAVIQAARMSLLGEGAPLSVDKGAVELSVLAEIKGHPVAQNYAGVLKGAGFLLGNDTPPTVWFRRSAEQNYASAQFMLGLQLIDSKNPNKDLAEAAKWFLLARGRLVGDEARLHRQIFPSVVAQLSPDTLKTVEAEATAFANSKMSAEAHRCLETPS